jgi:hypothetical protein
MDNFWFYLLIIAVISVVSLAWYAGKLLRQLSLQKEQQKQAALAHQQALNNHDKKVFDSILLITRAMEEEQCEFDEGCWRLSVLLASLKTIDNGLVEEKFGAIFALYNEIKTFAILKERKALSKKERMQQDFKRMTAETNLHDDVVADLKVLHQYARDNIEHLTS